MCLPQWDGDRSGWRDFQQQVRLYKTGENLEVNWSVSARLVGGLRGLAMVNARLTETVEVLKP